MKKIIFILIAALLSTGLTLAQADSLNLLGTCTVSDLRKAPHASWFVENYDSYIPNANIVKQLKDADMEGVSVSVFFGTWCGDSQREVPRMQKILDAIGFPQQAIKMIAVGSSEPYYRQSPEGAESVQHVYRVPTIIISRNGDEINRIVEYPSASLERDLFDIVTYRQYIPNYPSFIFLAQWLADGLLDDANVNFKGLANQIRYILTSENELNGFANIISRREKVNPAIVSTVLRINNYLYPNVYWTYTKLAESLSDKENKHDEATEVLQEGLDHIKDSADAERIQKLLDTVMSKL